MNSIIIKIIIYFGLKDLPNFIRLLAKLEYGVSSALHNLANDAEESKYFNLANQLRQHAQEEENHGKMLATLIDGKERIITKGGGRWLSYQVNGVELANHFELGGGKIIEDKEKGVFGIFQNLDGISQRYFSLHYFLKGKKMKDLPWESRLACMAVLEEGTNNFYLVLNKILVNEVLKSIALKISDEELVHSRYLKYLIGQFTPFVDVEIDRWRRRLWFAKFFLILDFFNYVRQQDFKKMAAIK